MPNNIYIIPQNNQLKEIPQFCFHCGIDRHTLSQMLAEPRELVGGKLQDTGHRLTAIHEINSCPVCEKAFKDILKILGISLNKTRQHAKA